MSDRSHGAERDWAAEKREFVADRRDEVAAERDAVAQVREEAADAREVAADEWERRLVARADESGRPSAPDVTQLTEARAARHQSRRDRDETIDDRDTAAADREQATERRHAENPSLRLATAFAAIAAHLYASDSYDEVLQRIAETAVSTVNGCEMASITINEGGSYRTACHTPIWTRRRPMMRSTKLRKARASMLCTPQSCTRLRSPTGDGRHWPLVQLTSVLSRCFRTV